MAVNNRVKIANDIELKDRLVAINRVTKVTKGGRTFSFSAIVVVGNEDGIIGWGLGKAGEVTAAIARLGGGEKAIAKQHEKGKYTAPFIQQHSQTLARCVFPFFVLLRNCFFTASDTCYGTAFNKLFNFFKLITHEFLLVLEFID